MVSNGCGVLHTGTQRLTCAWNGTWCSSWVQLSDVRRGPFILCASPLPRCCGRSSLRPCRAAVARGQHPAHCVSALKAWHQTTLHTPFSLMHSAAPLIMLTAHTTLGLNSSLGFFHVTVFLCVSWFVAARFVSQSKYLYSLKCYYRLYFIII